MAVRRRSRWRVWAAAAALGLAATGCAAPSDTAGSAGTPNNSAGRTSARPSTSAGAHGWSRDRLRAAIAKHAGTAHTAKATPLNAQVGAVFTHNAEGDHFCTASVVDSAGQNLIVTAAHCVYDPTTGQRSDLVFVPGYRTGESPNGVWPLVSITVDQSWKDDGNEDMDVAFAIVQPQNGRQIQQVLGASRLGINKGYQLPVRITGYPSSVDAPITCANNTTEQSTTQLRIDCSDYTGGTSGSPWVTDLDPKTRTGTVVGVIGGYQQGGDTPDISYSSYFGDQVQALYDRATG
ncbi:trypsin-like serine protease [Kitasatospora sp. GP82]|uniref:trypsin-like serine peptidase n=1 Tax=Kitasatospora sp. GP82 TaxID=3035089 RepID=UPI0024746D31|nr:trypsin-like serine protease [Kitasatospora sp. GP82]MDH6125284.1 V8-like Glu-specific endopeptidase [Kitasatospora sp. GP82]